ncbi:hypothetical protein ACKVMT_10185 [Halobacteriales archaeon Cl-PHB]
MADDDSGGFLQRALRRAGRQVGEARQEYEAAKRRSRTALPTDDGGQAKIVCRRHAEERAVPVDAQGRPDCFDADHPDCQGCVEDIRSERIQTW